MSNPIVNEWVKLVARTVNLSEYTYKVEGKSNKGDGYLSNITFININGKCEGRQKTLYLIVKSSKESLTLRQQFPLREAFESEIRIYDEVIPAFCDLQRTRTDSNLLDFLPKAVVSRKTGISELLILESLKPEGYAVWDRFTPYTIEGLRLILEAYSRWHAFSIALKQQNIHLFQKLIENNINMFSRIIIQTDLVDIISGIVENGRDQTIKNEKIRNKLMFSKEDFQHILVDAFFDDPDDQVILHGDGWNNNFMFTLEEKTKIPIKAYILDWQCASVGSPILDLSFFIYTCCDNNEHKDVKKLLKIYHESLSSSLKKLGVDVEHVFPFDKLLLHWKKNSSYGLIIACYMLRFGLCLPEDAPDFAAAAEEGKQFRDTAYFVMSNEDIYLEHIKSNLLHYVGNL